MEGNRDKNVVYFGKANFRSTNRLFGIKRKDRRQHMYVMGKSGTGKTTLIKNLMIQDIANGDGVCLVDPHGEYAEEVIAKIPKHRIKDVVYFNPVDAEFQIGFNPLEIPDPRHKHLIASGLMAIFTKIWAGVWSPRMEYILSNCILALLDTPGSTLLGIPRILVDKDFRQKIVNNIEDPVVKAFWVTEYESWRDQFRNEAIVPIQNKVGQFLSTSMIRNVVGQQKSTLDIFDIMNSQKILIVNVSKGRIGEDNAALLGAMIITKIQLTAMERVRIPEEERKDFFLYVDEFQNFATESFADILSEARKYRLNLILAHQYVGQLVTENSTKVRDAVFGNVGTLIIFRVGAADAEFLENEFTPELEIADLVNLPNYHIYLKLLVDGITSRPFSASTLPPFKMPTDTAEPAEIIEASRKQYTKPRSEIEKEINNWSGAMGEGGISSILLGQNQKSSGKPNAKLFSAVCSNCKKETKVNFDPDPTRPVYCNECYAKIKAGEMEPLPIKKERSEHEHLNTKPLAALGIEFEEEKKGKNETETPVKKSIFEEVGLPEPGRKRNRVSLSELKPNEKVPRERKRSEPDLAGLRASLKEALEEEKHSS
ncbi:MAG: hypothetical protein COU08_02795 [Candidatus Harrisonbacteria bacterium CG10_big_fil_rev_8_21_14_0_10_42_17]|uniref:Uncharacterized protein n=1 Tax=Candidatus Harrisonbacteria bacterium CG10_big_fil_rev_8_21_14_0_10_42_17 TaxID=1974584 RepID=A0A2M6WHX8_9BACT|nr:MAG: hypothetical protein COU08_02795 [Candidatus Harrisonbacteria bacterium CG10_big_fil_rev_8_21_14_0_10_42_17]